MRGWQLYRTTLFLPYLLPITVVFGFLQQYITTGIATTGMK